MIATLSKLRYLGIKIILDKENVNYLCVTIFQESELKDRLEKLRINRYRVTISSVDSLTMYPSINLSTIRKAVIFFSKNLPQQPKMLTTFSWSSYVLG